MKAFAAILTIYVLFGSIGAPIYKRICFAKEEVNYSFIGQDSCCSTSEASDKTVISETGCCDFSSTYLQVDYEAFSNSHQFIADISEEAFKFIFEQTFLEALNTDFAERGPPVFYGRTLLAFVQSFLL